MLAISGRNFEHLPGKLNLLRKRSIRGDLDFCIGQLDRANAQAFATELNRQQRIPFLEPAAFGNA